MKSKITQKLLAALVFAAVLGTLIGWAGESLAFIPGPFGGPIVAMRPGSNCIHITVGPPRPGDFVYIPGVSLLFSFFTIRPGAYVLGLAGPDVFCLFGRRAGFTGPIIIMVGTSL